MRPTFSERTFEFCYNAEFCQAHRALLAAHPHIPSQRLERDLGYDVAFELEHGGFAYSIFLQHKIGSFAENRVGINAGFYDAHGGSYYRFPVEVDQYNTLLRLAHREGRAFYCAPRFHRRQELADAFRATQVMRRSVWLDPCPAGAIGDDERHNITYDPNRALAFLHSEPKKLEATLHGGADLQAIAEVEEEVTLASVARLSNQLTTWVADLPVRETLAEGWAELPPIRRLQYLLGRVLGVSWLLVRRPAAAARR